ncbi:hypothetical protein, partial [Bradyrhizobium sp. NFR13]|uniref:hypothetical protein n=1 Tax=Bradyrhizobium sp. NFR13 TaxID=1566285 RepID=UPI001AECF4C2
MLKFRVRGRQGPAAPSGKPIGLPENDSLGRGNAPNIFSYSPLTASPSGLYSPLSCPTERGDRDRHVRG